MIRWEYEECPAILAPKGLWRAYVGADDWYVGAVYSDGNAAFGGGDCRARDKEYGSVHLAALALETYVKAGGR